MLVPVGIALLAIAMLGARSRLRRNRWAGVRTTATLRTDAAFVRANQVAAAPIGAAGAVAAAGGAVLLAGAGGTLSWVVSAVSVLGMVVLAGVGGMVGDRVATAAEPEPAFSPCAGTCVGCDLVTGCRDEAGETSAVPNVGPKRT